MGKRKEREGITLLNDHMLFAEEVLTKYERAELYDAVRAYSMEGTLPDMSTARPEWRGIFRIMRGAQDCNIKKYDEACERNRQRINRRWHGKPDDDADTGYTGNTEYTGNTGYTKQNKTRQNKINQDDGFDDPLDREGTGVPGIGWLE